MQAKLEPLGITEIKPHEIYYYETGDTGFYEIKFTPGYDGVGLAHEFGQMDTTDVIPSAMAWVTQDGVAMLNLKEVLGKVTEQTDTGKVLSFSQVLEILEVYLENNMLCGCTEAKLTQVEVVYYPDYKEPDLVLKPAWNIYLDAVTGELLHVER